MEKFKILLKYELASLIQSRWLWIYLICFNVLLAALRYFSNDTQQLYVSLLNTILLFHSIGLLLFSTLAWQNNVEFISFVLTQPVNRASVFFARVVPFYFVLGLSTALSLFVQMFQSVSGEQFFSLLSVQFLIEVIFANLGFFLAVKIQDRLKAMAMAAGMILLFCLIMDGLTLWIIINFSSYPLEKTVLALGAMNPLNLLKYQYLVDDKNVLWIGYSGLILSRIWQSLFVKSICALSLTAWLVGPLSWAWSSFKSRDF